MRLFVSVNLDTLSEQVAEIQSLFADASGLRLTDPEQAHITLKFIGETDESERAELVQALDSAVRESGVSPFEASFGGLGVFPHMDYISVVWLGVRDGADQLTRLHEHIERQTTALGFDPEDHEFTPHVTLARMDHAEDNALVQDVVQNTDPDCGRMTVESVHLTGSTLTPDGPQYSTVERFELS